MTEVGIVAHASKPNIGEIIDSFLQSLEQRSLHGLLAGNLKDVSKLGKDYCTNEELRRRADLIVAFGGDGTILMAARVVGHSGIPILGVNIGRLGFLTQIGLEDLESAIEKVLAGEYRLDSRTVLEGYVASQKATKYFALNDIVIDRGLFSRTIEIYTSIQGELVDVCTADGLIVSTPTGSTGYSLSAGGPIVHPAMDALIITPICPHSLSLRPMIISGDQELMVEIRSDHNEMMLTADGQPGCKLVSGDQISIKKSSYAIHLIDLQEQSFYSVLREKLKWGTSGKMI